MILGQRVFKSPAEVEAHIVVSLDDSDIICNITTIESDVTYTINRVNARQTVAVIRTAENDYTIMVIYYLAADEYQSIIIGNAPTLKSAFIRGIRAMVGPVIKLDEDISEDIYEFANELVLQR